MSVHLYFHEVCSSILSRHKQKDQDRLPLTLDLHYSFYFARWFRGLLVIQVTIEVSAWSSLTPTFFHLRFVNLFHYSFFRQSFHGTSPSSFFLHLVFQIQKSRINERMIIWEKMFVFSNGTESELIYGILLESKLSDTNFPITLFQLR